MRPKYVPYDSVVTGILEVELITVNDVIKEGSKDGTLDVLGALLFPSVKAARNEEISSEVSLSTRAFSNSFLKRPSTNP